MQVTVTFMGHDGPSGAYRTYSNVRQWEYEQDMSRGERLMLRFDNYAVHLFTRHIADVEIKE